MSLKVEICGVNTSTLKKLSSSQTKTLLEEYRLKGNKDAKEQLVLGNLRLVLSIVQRYPESKVDPEDMFQAGCVGLIKAIDNFDCNMDVRFSTYAVPMIIGEMRKIMRQSNGFKINRAVRDIAYKCIQARDKLSQTIGNPSLAEVAAELNLPEYEVVSALDAMSDTVSIYSKDNSGDDDGLTILDRIADKTNVEEKALNSILLSKALDSMPERESMVLKMRYFLGKTQLEISSLTGISQAQISRLEKNALERLKKEFSD